MIRKATEKDIDGIVAIYDKILDLQDEGKMSIGWAKNVYPTRDTVRKALERDDLFVYEEKGKIIASAIINQIQVDVYEGASWEYSANEDEVLVIHTLTVDPSSSHKGIGKEFLEFYENLAKEKGIYELRLDTNEINKIARSFYKKAGYKEIGVAKTVFNGIPNVNLILIEKNLKKK